MSYKRYSLHQQITTKGNFPTAGHISLIVILLFEYCFVIVIDCIDSLYSLSCILSVSVYNYCRLTVVLLKKHLILMCT